MKKASARVGLTNPKSPTNVGAVMRAAGCFEADGVYYTGSRYDRAAQFHTDTKSASQRIPLTGVDCLLDVLPELDNDTQLVCIDLVEGATSLAEFEHPEKAFYIFGPEDGSLSQAVVDRADAAVYIPTVGCLNLAATVNVVLYDRQAKLGAAQSGDALIRSSRDRNNSVSFQAG
ncbi:RNA methyltransferase [Aliamphritea spongicola]|uniref:RNA methyltransferase n=1 Tax=Aliamphritea spongicola TaxID=707589 RepID=UPI00196B6ED3|nr:RNA methyltransferase [Aliamphritea spongicola]MBN3563258.1 RNA methyltransferase [Aliamphritea spongicola]